MKRSLALILAMVMLFGMLPLNVFATDTTVATVATETNDPEVIHEHDYEAAVTAPTCTEEGYTTHTCTTCGDSYTSDHVVALGHSYKNGFCTNCGEKETLGALPLGSGLKVTVTPANYAVVSNTKTENLACAPCLVSYGEGKFAVAYLTDEVNKIETEASTTIVCRVALFDPEHPEQAEYLDIATAGQTIGDVTIGSKAPYEPNLLALADGKLLAIFNLRSTTGKYIYYSACIDPDSRAVTAYAPLTLDGKEWVPANVASSYNALTGSNVSAPSGSMVFTSKIIEHDGYSYGYCGGISSGFAGILVRSTDGINWTSVMAPQAASDMAGVIECGFGFIDEYVYFCMRDISSGVYQCAYNFTTGQQLTQTEKLPELTTSKTDVFRQDGKLYIIVNKATDDDSSVGRRNTARIYAVKPETCELTLVKELFCADGIAYHSVLPCKGNNYWCFHTDARRIEPYTQGRSNLALMEMPALTTACDENGILQRDRLSGFVTSGCITAAANQWQAGVVNLHYQLPITCFTGYDTVTITANAEQKAYVAFFHAEMKRSGDVAYADGWTNQVILEPGETRTFKIPADAQYLYILNNNAAGNDLFPTEVRFYHDHSYTSTVTAPTCTEQGYTTYTCICGDSYVDDYVDALGHIYENGICTGCGAENPNPYAGKTIACIGDSITYGVGVTRDETDYVTVLAQDLEMNYIRLGASGTTLCTDGHATCNIGKLTEENLAGADVVTILMGINDFVQARNGYYQLGTIDSTDTSTIYGAVHMWCQRIVQLRQTDSLKDTEFIFLTPVMTSWNNSVSSVRNWDQGKTNIHGYTLRDLCNAIVEVCALYDIPVIDLNLVSGLYYNSAEDNTVSQFGGDGAHPGAVGHQMMAEAIKHALLKDNLRNDHDHSYGSWITTKYPGCEDGEEKRICSVCTATESRALDATGHSYADGACTLCGQKDYRNVTYVAFGDSITYGVDGNYRDGPGRIMDNPYPELVGQILDFGFVNNQGVSGGTLCADSGFTNMTQRILNFNGKADVISIMLGVNDYQVGCPIGDIDSVDNKTIYGSLNLICQHLTENYPDAFLFFMTPFQYRGGDEDRGAGYNLPAVADAIKEVAAKYDIPVLDMYTYGRYEDEFSDTSLAYQDGIHPSQQHHINYTAPLIAEFLTENYEGPAEDDSQGGQESDEKIVYRDQALVKGYCTKAGEVASSGVHSYFTMDAEGIETITITPPDAPAWNPYDIYYIVIVEEDGTVSCYGKLGKQEPTVIELGGKVKGTVYFNAFYDDHPEYVYVKEAVVIAHAHDYEAVATEPTCTAQGYTTCICDCGDSYVDDYVDATGHAYENGICTGCGEATLGDLDLDGDVDAKDLTLLARHVSGIELVAGTALMNADVNSDGLVNSDDLTKHARYVARIITSWDQE